MRAGGEILLVEDDETDVLLLQRALKEAGVNNPVTVARDGEEGIEELSRREYQEQDYIPLLAILDLKMPRRNGLEMLKWIRQQPALRCLPVFMFSSSAHREDVERAYAAGANAFLVKPSATAERLRVAALIRDWLQMNQAPLAATEGLKSAMAFHAARGIGIPPPRI